MGLFSWLFPGKTPAEILQEQRYQQTLAELAKGGIPIEARERIERDRAQGKEFFSSDFTVSEFLVSKEVGVEPLDQVMGSSFYNVRYGAQYGGQRWRGTGELLDLSKAHLDSRSLAISRMQQEAELRGASGVIGVRIKSNLHDWSSRLTEFTAVGTAVTIPGYTGKTFTSALSAQDFWLLYKAGYMPVDVAMGVCSYYMYTDYDTRNLLCSWWGGNQMRNVEVPLYSNGLQIARETAMDRLTRDMEAHGANEVVGMDVEYEMEEVEYESGSSRYRDMVAHFIALGTSVVFKPDLVQKKSEEHKPLMFIDLTAKKKARHGPVRLDTLDFGHTAETEPSR